MLGKFFGEKFCKIKKDYIPSHPVNDTDSSLKIAQMAELVDALDSKSCFRKGVQVRFLFWALRTYYKEDFQLYI